MSIIHATARSVTRLYTTKFPINRGKWRALQILDPLLRIPGERQIATVADRFKMDLDLEDYVQSWIYFFGCYERPLFDLIVSTVRPGDVFVDAGANVGQFSLLAASLGARVHSFEPSPDNIAALKRNLDLNPSLRIELHSVAVSDNSGCATFFPDDKTGSAKNCGSSSLVNHNNSARSVTVQTVKLDNELSDLSRLDFLKIDIEGADLLALRGASRLISRFSPIIAAELDEVQAQCFGYSTSDTKTLLFDRGYKLFRQRGMVPIADTLPERCSVIALPPGRLSLP